MRVLFLWFALCLAVGIGTGCPAPEHDDTYDDPGERDDDGDDDDGYDPPPTCCECNCSYCSATVNCTPDCGSCYSACQDACSVCGGVMGASEC